MTNTATIITHTGLFDKVDELYKTKSGTTQTAGAAGAPPEGGPAGGPPPPPGGPPPPPPGGPEPGGPPTLPENEKKNNLNILLENDNFLNEQYFNMSRGSNSLGDIEEELLKILNH